MSVVLRHGAVHSNDLGILRDTSYLGSSDGVDVPTTSDRYFSAPIQTYPGCFGLPYQDHNYGAPPPITPPTSPPSTSFIEAPVVISDKINRHIEIDEVTIPVVAATEVAKEISVEDDSITRCICDYTHDDGYMICCDKCSVWQHIDCMAVDRNNIPESYYCEICEPRPVDKERAYQLQTKRKELLITDSSATDTDPEEAMNRQMSQQQQQQLPPSKKSKSKKKTKVKVEKPPTSPNKSGEPKQRKARREKKDIKKEKENKDTDKKQKAAIKEAISKKINNKSKLNKKPGLTLVVNENAQDPWDSSYSPWVDKYEEARENHYSADILALVSMKVNGQHVNGTKSKNGKLLVQLCHVTEVSKNRKGLEASETIGEGEPIIEYTGKVMLKQQFDRDNFFKQFNPFVLFYNKYDNLEMCVDATSFGNTARFIRRSCKANAEVRHVIENGEMFFYVYSAKVIPRGSEITIPYDYNYKECTYCVECACLRNNCPVAKYFKKRQNAQNKKEKNSSKTPKSPGKPTAKSPVKSPTKSPVKKNIEFPKTEEIVEKTSNEKIPCETDLVKQPAMLPPTVVTRSCKEQEPEQIKTEPKEAKETEHSCDSNSGMDTWSHSDTEDSNQVLEKGHKMTREERKMEAIMKAFEKLEKREERRKEALARLDHKADHKCHSETLSSNVISDEKIAEQNTEKEVESVQEPEIVAPVKKEIIEEPELEPVAELPVMKKDIKPKKKAKKVASRRKSRISSACSSETSTSVSIDENSNTTSCPSTPLPSTPLAAEIVNSPPSFKFLKTKKHLMSEWLNEKSQDCSTTPLEVSVEDALFVTCLPSPRNSMEHLRRNSQNSVMVGTSKVDNSIGSAKKRWLRQAMWDKPAPESRSNSPVAASVDTSPNQICTTSMPSPGASPPGDFVTPLKKRRMARESCDQQLPIPSTSSLPMDLSVEEGASSNQDGDLEKNLTENDTACTKPFTVPLDSAITEGEKSDDSKHSDSATSLENFNRGMELLVCEINQSLQKCSSRTSSDISDAEQEKISNLEAQFTGTSCNSMDNLSFVNEERTSVNVRSKLLNVSSDNVDTEATCASSSGVDVCDQEVNKEERMDMECGQRNLAEYETDSQRHHIEMTVNEGEAFSEKTTESMEVDSTEDSAQTQMSDDKNQACKKQAVCDSTSSKVEVEMSVNGGFSDSAEVAEPDCGSSASCPSTSKSSPVTKENSVVDSSTDCSVSLGREVGFVSTDQTCSSAADQSAAIARTFTSLSESAAVSTVDQSEDGCHEYLSSSRSEVMSVADQSSDRETNRAETVVDSGQQDIAQSHEQSKESLVESISDVTCNEQLSLSSNDIDENVGSSSDETKSTCLFDVSSSSELRSSVTSDTHQESLTVGSSQPTENMNVSSTGQLCPVDDSMLVSGGMADSSEAAAASTCRLDSDQNSVQEVCSVPPCVTNSSCTTNMSEADTLSAEQNRSVSEECKHQGEPTSSSSSLSSSALEESIQASTSSVSPEPSPLPVPTKKKVSLLEYRKRLKEKHTTSSSISNPIYQSSSSPSSQTSPSLSTSYNSSSSFNNPSSTTSRAQSLHGNSRRLVSLPSLPLFDSSPTKDQSRHQFRSSSDLIKRKSSEVKKREKPLSLSERLKLEFGVDDSEEDHEANEKPLEASNQAIGQHPEMSHQQHGPPRYQQPIYSPQIPSPHIQIVPQVSEHPPLQPHIGQQNPIRARGPSPGLLPHQHHMAAQGGPPPQHTNQPVPPPGILNPVPHAIRNNAPPMMNGPGLAPGGPPVRPGGQIPSLMSLQTFPTINLQSNSGQSPSPQQPNPQQPQNSFTGQHISNIEQGMVVNQQGIMSHEQQQYGQQQHSNILPNQGNVTSGGYPHTPPQQGFTQPPNGTNFNLLQKSPMQIPPYSSPQQQAPPSAQAPSPQTNGPVVHDYNHGFGSVPTMHCSDGGGGHKQQRYSPSPTYHNIHQQGSLQRKSKKKKKNKVYNHQKQTYPDSGGHY